MSITAQDEGINYEDRITYAQIDLITALLSTSVFDEQQRKVFSLGVEYLDQSEAQQVVDYLMCNQLDPVTQRGNHSAGEANKRLKKITK